MTTPNEGEIDVDELNSYNKDNNSVSFSTDKNNGETINDIIEDGDVEEPVPVAVEPEEEANDDMGMVKDLQDGAADAQLEVEECPKGPTFFSDEKGNLKFVNLVVRNPCCIFFSLLVLCLVISFLLMAIVFRAGNPFTDGENEFDLKDLRSIQYDSLRLAQKETEEARDAFSAGSVPILRQSEGADITYWVFEGETDEGLFGSAESIGAMKEAFDLFMTDSQYDQYCLLNYPPATQVAADNSTNATTTTTRGEPSCETPLTSLAMYYPAEWDSAMVAAVIEEFKVPGNIELFNSLALCYSLNLYCDLLEGQNISESDVTWALQLGGNLTSITNSWDMSGELVQNFTQVTELAAHLKTVDIYKGLVDFGYDKGFSVENQVSLFSRGIIQWGGPLGSTGNLSDLTVEQREAQDEAGDDERKDYIVDNFLKEMDRQASGKTHKTINSYYFMIALLFDVLIGIIQQDGMLALFSLAFVFLWLRINTGSWFLAGVGILEIFLAIPVAWFLFSVVFRIKYFGFLNALSIFIVAAIGADDIFIFMDAYKQSKHKHPEHLHSMEDRMSWVYRRTGTAMAITSATTCAAFLCTLITPLASIQSFGIFAATVILIDYVLVMTLFFSAVVIYHDRFEDRSCFGCCCTDCSKTDPSPTEAAQEALKTDDPNEEVKGDRVSEFFRVKVAGFIQVPMNRMILGLIFVSWLGVAVWQTSKIEATKESEQFLDGDHPLQKSLTIINSEFPTADDDVGLKVYYTWGIGEVDRSGVNLLLDPENFGKPTFLESFDFNEQCQTEMLKACDKLRTDSQYRGYIKQKGGIGLAYCFMEELGAFYVKGDLSDCEYVQQGDWRNEDWQVPASELASVMERFLQQRSCADQTETIPDRYGNEMGWDGTRMRYAAFAVESEVLNPFSQDPEALTRGQYNEFISIAEELDTVISPFCSGPVIMTDLATKFVFMNNQAIYVQTAIQSSILGVAIAFVVLLISTRVFHIAFFASLSIISVLVSVTGTMVMLGWNLGSIESILIGIIAGFSVDYVVHLAHAYETASGDTNERLSEAFGDMGISVLNGMVTSVAASIPLFFCQLQFFSKFGTFLCLTIAFSWIFANFAFMSVLAQFKIPIKKGGCRL